MFDELTKQDIFEMQAEIDERIKKRASFHDDIVMARSYGDLSENAEYREAKKAKNKNESRIRYLKSMIKTAKIVETTQSEGVDFFDKVSLLFDDTNETEEIVVSTKMRVDATKGVISKESPLGSAIFGKKVGEKVFVDVSPDVQYYVTIVDIKKGDGKIDVPLNKYWFVVSNIYFVNCVTIFF